MGPRQGKGSGLGVVWRSIKRVVGGAIAGIDKVTRATAGGVGVEPCGAGAGWLRGGDVEDR